MQRLLREAGERVAARSDRQVEAGFEIVTALVEAKALHLRGLPFVKSLLQHARQAQTAYLAHEYMNEMWRPCFHADVVAALVGSKARLGRFRPSPREFFLADAVGGSPGGGRTVRRPGHARARQGHVPAARLAPGRLCARRASHRRPPSAMPRSPRSTSALLCSEAQFVWEVEVPSGKAELERGFFGPVVAALAQGPQRVGDLLALPGSPRHDNPAEIIGMLVGTDQALPVLGPPDEPDPLVRRFNAAAAKRFVRSGNLNTGVALATSGTRRAAAVPDARSIRRCPAGGGARSGYRGLGCSARRWAAGGRAGAAARLHRPSHCRARARFGGSSAPFRPRGLSHTDRARPDRAISTLRPVIARNEVTRQSRSSSEHDRPEIASL